MTIYILLTNLVQVEPPKLPLAVVRGSLVEAATHVLVVASLFCQHEQLVVVDAHTALHLGREHDDAPVELSG